MTMWCVEASSTHTKWLLKAEICEGCQCSTRASSTSLLLVWWTPEEDVLKRLHNLMTSGGQAEAILVGRPMSVVRFCTDHSASCSAQQPWPPCMGWDQLSRRLDVGCRVSENQAWKGERCQVRSFQAKFLLPVVNDQRSWQLFEFLFGESLLKKCP